MIMKPSTGKLKWERETILTIKFRPAWIQPRKTDIIR